VEHLQARIHSNLSRAEANAMVEQRAQFEIVTLARVTWAQPLAPSTKTTRRHLEAAEAAFGTGQKRAKKSSTELSD